MRRLKRKTKRPKSPWDMQRIVAEKALTRTYGLRRKKEIRVAEALLRNFRRRARGLIAVADEQEKGRLLGRLEKLGLLKTGAGLDEVLVLGVQDVLNRRLQTIVFRKGMALSPQHARQMIVHEQVEVGGRVVKYPSYLVSAGEEEAVKARKVYQKAVRVGGTELAAEGEGGAGGAEGVEGGAGGAEGG